MHTQAAPIAQDTMPVGSRTARSKGGDSSRNSDGEDDLGTAPQQTKVVVIDSYPTDAAVRHKEQRKAREEKLAEEGLAPAGIKALHERKKFNQEDHFDDCGSGLGPLGEASFVNALVVDGSPNSTIAYSFLDRSAFCSSSAEGSEDELEKVLNGNYSLHCLLASSGAEHHVDPPSSVQVDIEHLCTFLAKPEYESSMVDVVELFGGESGVGKPCVRRRLSRGEMFDIVTGFDLSKEAHQKEVIVYVKACKPSVVIMCPRVQASGIGAT